MNVPDTFVEILTEEDYTKMVENHRKRKNHRVRNRAQAVFLSFEKYPIDEITAELVSKVVEIEKSKK